MKSFKIVISGRPPGDENHIMNCLLGYILSLLFHGDLGKYIMKFDEK